MTTILHLSDPHLDGTDARRSRLRRAIGEIANLPALDAIVVTGDIADHGETAEYAEFFGELTTRHPCIAVPGNHDLRDAMSAHVPPDTHGYLNSTTRVGPLTIVGLDSLIESEVGGALAPTTVEYARRAITGAPGPVVLAMHHPPVPVGHPVMDRHGLTNADTLADLLEHHPRVAAVLTGHVHTALASTFAHRPVLGAPGIVSTMRLGGQTQPIADQRAAPGLALHTIDGGGQLSSIFHYLTPEAV